MMMHPALLLAEGGFIDSFKAFINFLCAPFIFLPLTIFLLIAAMVGYRTVSKPLVAGIIALLFTGFYVASMGDPNFLKIIAKPDNVPITMMIFALGYFMWLSFRRAALNDARMQRGQPLLEAGADDKVLVWPDLVYTELIALILCTVFLVVWGIVLKAPLEQPANPSAIPNPSKAPWYFLGLQELLVYFDPWIAGVLLPGLIIVGLIAIPYIDRNPRGNGYYTFKQRPMAWSLFLFGFVIMWCVLIVVGTFLRGPNWNLFGPYEYWDPHKPAALVNVNVSEIFWIIIPSKLNADWWKPGLPDQPALGGLIPGYIIRELPGIALVGAYFFVLPVILARTVFRRMYKEMGVERYFVFWLLLSWMAIVPIKMVLRWIFNLKYFLALTEWFFNI